ncbi:MAG: NAD(P)/FAD-dependent oxidoreductase [Tissierellia bacterium]|nr:NAD(P)/FAD-dependent oxidoreductase [Tissierellia bacterium]
MYDIIIIGSGVSGTAVARELSRYQGKFALLERGSDIGVGTSKANSGIIHGGYDAKEGSLMAKLNVEGNQMMEKLAEELEFPYQNIGSLVLCFEEENIHKLYELKRRGEANGVKDLTIIDGEELTSMEPHVSKEAIAALYCGSAGIVCPFNLNIAMAENAYENGVEFFFNQEVIGFEKKDYGWNVITENDVFKTRGVVNAAGVYADKLHNMVSKEKMKIIARRGDYLLMDKEAQGHVKHTIFQLPSAKGKGVLATPTVDGNLLIGPTARDIENKEDVSTTKNEIDILLKSISKAIEDIPYHLVITSFSGLRAHEEGHDFIIEEVKDGENFFDVAGIESPGLTASPAIGKMVAGLIQEKFQFEKNPDFDPKRKGITFTRDLSLEEHNALIKKNSQYGRIVCRCEKVTEGEIVDAIHRSLGAKTLDGIKRRTRTMAGRCQGGFCTPRIIEIMARELEVDPRKVIKDNFDSNLVVTTTKTGVPS